jgi:DNA-binding Xre family transcriptional regulator
MAQTKIAKLLEEKKMSQRDLQRAIIDMFGVKIGDDRISKICTGRLKNYHTNTAVMLAMTLNVKVDEILEY